MYAVVALGGTRLRMPVSETTNLPCCCRCRCCCCSWLAAAAAATSMAATAAATAAAGSLLGFEFCKLGRFRVWPPELKLAEGECSVSDGGSVGQPSLHAARQKALQFCEWLHLHPSSLFLTLYPAFPPECSSNRSREQSHEVCLCTAGLQVHWYLKIGFCRV
jgi:hypothetical protein